jgi:hypothetical protein
LRQRHGQALGGDVDRYLGGVTSESKFGLVCEIEPPTRPDLRHVRHQIGVLAPVARSFLIPDNHMGRPTVSSSAVAHEVSAMGAPAAPLSATQLAAVAEGLVRS